MTRWILFAAVGVLGCGLHLAVLAWLTGVWHISELTAVALAVEAAILHNFVLADRVIFRRTRPAAPKRGLDNGLQVIDLAVHAP